MTKNTDTVQAIELSFLAGYVDTLGFISLFGLFTAHVTGNFVLIGKELAFPSHGVLIKFLAFPAFIISVALTRLLILSWQRSQQPALLYAFLLQLVLLLGFMVCGFEASPVVNAEDPLVLAAGILGASAMAVQNTFSKLLLPQLAPTTVMTGNVTQLVVDLVDIARGDSDASLKGRCAKFFWPVIAFGVGAISAAFAFSLFGFLGLIVPCIILISLAFQTSQL